MSEILKLKAVEEVIEKAALKYKFEGADLEDLIQLGRIATWKVIEDRSITVDNYSEYLGLFYFVTKTAILSELARANRKKRIPTKNLRSLDKPIAGLENDLNLHEKIASSQETPEEKLIFKESVAEIDEEKFINLLRTSNLDNNLPLLLKKLKKKSIQERTPQSKKVVIWLLVHMLKVPTAKIPFKINYNAFVKNGLGNWLWIFFNNSPFRAINFAYPCKFLLHQLRAPQGYWIGEKGKKRAVTALKNAFKSTQYSSEMYPKLMTESFLEEFKLTNVVTKLFNGDRYAFINMAYPNKYHPWEFLRTPKKYFDSFENTTRAVRWLVEEKLGYPIETLTVHEIWKQGIAQKITKETFGEYGLRELMAQYKSPEPLLNLVYPGKFLKWSFASKTKWKGEEGKILAGEATRWLIEEHLKLSVYYSKIDCELFRRNGLWGMITSKVLGFNTSPKAVLKNAYPDKDFFHL